jgi:hypothetical protein
MEKGLVTGDFIPKLTLHPVAIVARSHTEIPRDDLVRITPLVRHAAQ